MMELLCVVAPLGAGRATARPAGGPDARPRTRGTGHGTRMPHRTGP